MHTPADCFTCLSNEGAKRISPGCTIYEGRFWLVEHAYPCGMKGWLVLVLKRHAEALHELTAEEFEELGGLQGRTARVLHEALDCEKEYAMCLAEAPGFHHIHFHCIGKPRGLAGELIGAKIFALLKVTADEAVPPQEIAALCQELHTRFAAANQADKQV